MKKIMLFYFILNMKLGKYMMVVCLSLSFFEYFGLLVLKNPRYVYTEKC